MITKMNSVYFFTKKIQGKYYYVSLTLYIDYINKTYNFMQDEQEGIFPRNHNENVEINKAYFKLGLEVLDFVEKELFNDKINNKL